MAKHEAFPMNGGSGLYSYTRNSTFQRKDTESAIELINKGIAEKLDLNNISSSSNTFRLADLGCSVGPNTFLAVQNIVDSVEDKYKSQGLSHLLPEFQVFFNDHISNDFNQLFSSLPPERRYYASGVPGSFHGRLFPSSSLHFVYSSNAVHWLSRVPKEVLDKNSPAWNKGRIQYSNSPLEVVKSYEAQYFKDMERFLTARSQEIVHGGLMALLVPACPNETPHSELFFNEALALLGSCVIELAKKSMISEEKVDSFNLPLYYAPFQQLEAIVDQNGYFSIEIMESLTKERPPSKLFSSVLRAGLEGLIKQHFGDEIDLDKLFDLYYQKFEEISSTNEPNKPIVLFLLLKRKEQSD
ncbi:loganic acid O-methyltransferase-like [Ziziphus jujuba]|uniref:Loganic acid O-methyltransferase-like n=1 Tax=Ziziphus jujuba TaxID=326968 RepID=A0A6P4AB27_ZIZJJ|nr:loganic acid O-methyltransferase-like [Ziziphus jujuba]XP_024930135.1 loganic acid O-methyltransferase-like [Ziziphus jujuba]XP_060670847.1 loganic acid O-methyltransferase-like [Ziziphus jujuba]